MLTTKEQKRVAEEISNSSNVIGKGTVLEGNIETFGNIRIEGKVIGNIKSKSKIALGNSSHVEGNITAQNADIEGEVKGKLEISEMLVLKSTSVVHGCTHFATSVKYCAWLYYQLAGNDIAMNY